MKRILSALLAITVLVAFALPGLFVNSAFADGSDNDVNMGDDINYEDGSLFSYELLDNGTITLTKYNGENTEIYIPSEIDGYTVTGLSNAIFAYNYKYTKIVLPKTIKSIGNSAFNCCYNLEYVNIPKSVENIGSSAFRYTRLLSAIDFENGNSVYNYIDGVVYNSDYSKTIACAGAVETVDLPSSVITIGTGSFYGCDALRTIHGGTNVTEIQSMGFSECKALESIANFSNVEIIGKEAFSYTYALKEVEIPRTVISIGKEAFLQSFMTKLIIHSNISTVPANAFENCFYLNELILDEGVKTIEKEAFYCCWRMKKISFPSTLTTIGDYAFIGFDQGGVYIPPNITKIGKMNFGYYRNSMLKDTLNTDFIIYGYSGSAAETYANNNGLVFVDVENLFTIDVLGGSLRLSEPNGLRLGFKLNENQLLLENANTVELGFIYTYSSSTENLTLENVGENGIRIKQAENYLYENNSAIFNLVFTNIPQSKFNTDITARAYAIINGIVYYSQPLTRNALYVAQRAAADESLSKTARDKINNLYGV